ncbi:MAG: TonB-dependent receptor plug domain-containing protein [Rhodospirillaceae bacterium]
MLALRHKRSFSLFLSSTVLSVAPVAARAADLSGLDEIVVTASRTLVPLKTVGSAIDVLTAEDIAQRPRFEVADLLREVPGVAVNRSGQRGSQTQVRMRGAEGNHTLVLINGIEVGDPMTADEFDFANLLTDDVARVEVLRGPQSALYGSQAIGGVINIMTREGHGPLEGSVSAQGGSFGTYALSGTAAAGGDGYSLGASLSWLDTDGISQAASGAEKDGHQNFTFNASGHVAPNEVFDLSLAARYTQAYGEEDIQDFMNFGGPTYGAAIDSDNSHRTKTAYGRIAGRFSLLEGMWDHTIAAAVTDVRKRNFDMKAFSFGAQGRRINLSYQTNLFIGEEGDPLRHTMTGYIQYKDEDFENQSAFPGPQNQRKSTQDVGYVAEYRLAVANQLFVSGALRHDDNDLFRNATTYRATAAWQIPGQGLKLRASYGTGFAKPGFFELFGFDPTSFVGNPNLKPESSHGWDVGADYAVGETALLSATYFSADFRDEILNDFSVFPFTVRNAGGESTRRGLELSARYTPVPQLTVAASYGYTEAEDEFGFQEVRRPKHIASVSASYRFLADRASVGVSADYNGSMTDVVFVPSIPSGVARMDDFTLVTVSGSYDVTDTIQVFGWVENALDQRYQEVYTYGTLGIGAYAGVKVRFGG